jgi:hypothetical protein
MFPHPSPIGPHCAPAAAHVMGVQAPEMHWLLMHEPAQLPQLKRPPQPSAAGPHVAPRAWQVEGVHVPTPEVPHLLAPPPPQYDGATQVPQSITPPQPSPC